MFGRYVLIPASHYISDWQTVITQLLREQERASRPGYYLY